jgi:hypothetical protein
VWTHFAVDNKAAHLVRHDSKQIYGEVPFTDLPYEAPRE